MWCNKFEETLYNLPLTTVMYSVHYSVLVDGKNQYLPVYTCHSFVRLLFSLKKESGTVKNCFRLWFDLKLFVVCEAKHDIKKANWTVKQYKALKVAGLGNEEWIIQGENYLR